MLTTAIDTYKYLRDHPGLPFGQAEDILTPREWYDMLWAYYSSMELYQAVQVALEAQGKWIEGMRPLRNPSHRAVEFHVSHLWPGPLDQALPIQGADALKDAIDQVWAWSNWGNKKQLAARWYALFGDLYIKVVTGGEPDAVERVYFQIIDPRHVVDHDVDERGFITWIRLDVPKTRRGKDGKMEPYIFTEVWDKAQGTYRAWEHDKDFGFDLEKLTDPIRDEDITEAFGIDFVPFVHAPFVDVGKKRGASLLKDHLLKIDEVNRQATRLHQILFRNGKPTWAIETNMMDSSGRPLPPPSLQGRTPGADDTGDTIDIGDDRLYRLPGMAKLVPLVPAVDYAAALDILNAQMEELESDLPELSYKRIREQGELSGRAVRLMLGDAVDRVIEARGNAETAIIRANQMALTIGQQNDLDGFGAGDIGTYEAGDFDHTFVPRDVIPESADERGQTLAQMTTSGIPIPTAMRLLNYQVDQVAMVEADLAAQQAQAERDRAQATLQALRDIQAQGSTDTNGAAATATAAPAGVDTEEVPENVETSQGLNGSQMASVEGVIEKIVSGMFPDVVAVELLISAGIRPERARRMIDAALAFKSQMKTTPPEDNPDAFV